jgi:serine/threonine-protein kinase
VDLERGAKIGDYRIIKKLGEGGMGQVYLALHDVLNQQVVIKRLHGQLHEEPEMRERFAREAQALARLNHPNIVHIHNFLEAPEGACIVMEYVEGETFEELIDRVGLIPPARAVQLLIPVLSAMAYAHSHNVIHRDIKPANIMVLRSSGEIRVLDFGTAKMADRPGLTRAGMTLGTATYMAPEQLLGRPLTPAADIYAIGVTLYEMCTGRLPFESDDTASLVRKVLREPPVSPRVFYPLIPDRLEAVILRCLEKKPEDRYQDVADLEREMRELLKGLAEQTIMGLKPAGPERTPEVEAAAAGLGSGEGEVEQGAEAAASRVPAPAPAVAVEPESSAPPKPAVPQRPASPRSAPAPASKPTEFFPLGLHGVLVTLLVVGAGLVVGGAGVVLMTLSKQMPGLVMVIAGACAWLVAIAVLGLSVVQLDERFAAAAAAAAAAREDAAHAAAAAEKAQADAAAARREASAGAAGAPGAAGRFAPPWAAHMQAPWGYGPPSGVWHHSHGTAAPGWPEVSAHGHAAQRGPSKRMQSWRHVRVEPNALTPDQIAAIGRGEPLSGPAPEPRPERRKTKIASDSELQEILRDEQGDRG